MPVRVATTNDSQAISEIHVQAWQHTYREILPPAYLSDLSVSRRKAIWAESIERNLPHVLVAEVDGQVVGFSAVGPSRDEDASIRAYELWAIYLSPSYWSKGIGRELWLASRKHAVERGATSLSLWVIASNKRAIMFYKSAGFEVAANSLKFSEIGGARIETVRYAQRLDG
jgi:ribosomal protein S18 acetylase RimI-like enzyme